MVSRVTVFAKRVSLGSLGDVRTLTDEPRIPLTNSLNDAFQGHSDARPVSGLTMGPLLLLPKWKRPGSRTLRTLTGIFRACVFLSGSHQDNLAMGWTLRDELPEHGNHKIGSG